MLNPTPPEKLVDSQGHPYFLGDTEMTLAEFRSSLEDPDPEVRAYLVGKLMRQAKPDDVFTFVSPQEILKLWPLLDRYLGNSRPFWKWLFESWEALGKIKGAQRRGTLRTVREEAQEVVERLPDHATWDDLMYELYVRQKIAAGLQAADAAKVVAHEDVREKFSS